MGSELLSDIRSEIEARLAQLRPAVEEYERLLAAAEVIEHDSASRPPADEAVDHGGGRASGFAPAEAIDHGERTSDSAGPEASDHGRASDLAPDGLVRRAGEEASLPSNGNGTAPPGRERRAPGRAGRAKGSDDGALREAIVAALEHGSHTPAELAVVTGEGTVQVNRELRRLDGAGLVAKSEREGKLAWSLVSLATSD